MNTILLPYTSRTDSFQKWMDAVIKCEADLSDTRLILLRSSSVDKAVFYEHLKLAEDTFAHVEEITRSRPEPQDTEGEVLWWSYCYLTTWHRVPTNDDIILADTHWLPVSKDWNTDLVGRMNIKKASACSYGVRPVEKQDPIKIFGPVALSPSFWEVSRIFRRYVPGSNLRNKFGFELKTYGHIISKEESCFKHVSQYSASDEKPAAKKATKKTAKKAAKKAAKRVLDPALKEKAVANLKPPVPEAE